ncbi:MAG: DUF3572 domain-containing protein [Pseudomonadota bacterium]
MTPQDAEDLAVAAMIWIAGDAARTSAFLGASGAEPGDLRARVADPQFLAFVLDFLVMDDATVMGFADAHAIDPTDVARARAGLPGGNLPNWT